MSRAVRIVLLATLMVSSLVATVASSRAGSGETEGEQATGRRAVLPQVDVPHSYYWREMYVPQVTSGPRSPSWSPAGDELVYAMQGSLWRQAIDARVAIQLTDGPGYHHQPDWSPDGRWIVYVAYDGEAMDLRVLDLDRDPGADPETGADRVLLSNGAVNVEPRLSPDGKRLAWVSTAELGRWHVWVAPFEDGRLGAPRRVTEDRDSGLPRYYYSRYDHYLSPTWSPDGTELILVSNRGRIWGSGGFWRQVAEPGATPREIRYEETTWRGRPDWGPGGHRVVYASYLGRQRHQLWLMTDEGGDVFPLTYGDFDATEPRWSPDGRRIAYVSNEGGNTSLWIIEVPGGDRRRLEIAERRTLRPTGSLRIEVVSAEGALPSRISVTGEDGRGWTPATSLRHADDAFDRAERSFETTYFHSPGSAQLELPAGAYTVEVVRGPEYAPARREVIVEPGSKRRVVVRLTRIADPEADGWYSGDLHAHMNYGGAYVVHPEDLVAQAAAEDLDFVDNLVVNKEQRIPDIHAFRTDRDPASTEETRLFHGQEFHTSFWGHTALLGLRSHLLLPDYAAYVNTAAASLYPHNAAVAEMARAQGAIVGYVHPFESVPDPHDRSAPLTHELPVDVALGKVDYLEVVGFSDHLATAEVWYRLLNCGFRLPAGAGTDAMTNFASLRGPVGLNRVYVRVEGHDAGAGLARPDHRAFLEGIRAGRTLATNGPLLQFSIEVTGEAGGLAGGAIPGDASRAEVGDELRLPSGAHRLRLRGSLRSPVPVDHLEVVANGEVVAELPLSDGGRSAQIDRTIEVTDSGWYTLRAWSEDHRHPVLDVYPFATTSPIWVLVGERPVRSAEDAAYFLAWIDRIEQAVRAHDGWNSKSERDAVLESLRQAREVYQNRSRSRRASTARPLTPPRPGPRLPWGR